MEGGDLEAEKAFMRGFREWQVRAGRKDRTGGSRWGYVRTWPLAGSVRRGKGGREDDSQDLVTEVGMREKNRCGRKVSSLHVSSVRELENM